MASYYNGWAPYVTVASRRADAIRETLKLKEAGKNIAPVIVDTRALATTFWGKAWCQNLESYSDYAYRLPRGRSYVRNRAVMDLQIASGTVTGLVRGASTYQVKVQITPVRKPHWDSICQDCAGGIDSLVELLQGRLSTTVMERVCREGAGLFPKPSEIKFSCNCPDYADMCKHVAAVLYGVGARLDGSPEMLFRLRAVDERDLLSHLELGAPQPARLGAGKALEADDLSALFGLEMATDEGAPTTPPQTKAKVRAKPKG